MVGCMKGLTSFVKKENDVVTHCFLHREALMAKTLGSGYFAVDGNLPLESILP